jgi:hypothetical protein
MDNTQECLQEALTLLNHERKQRNLMFTLDLQRNQARGFKNTTAVVNPETLMEIELMAHQILVESTVLDIRDMGHGSGEAPGGGPKHANAVSKSSSNGGQKRSQQGGRRSAQHKPKRPSVNKDDVFLLSGRGTSQPAPLRIMSASRFDESPASGNCRGEPTSFLQCSILTTALDPLQRLPLSGMSWKRPKPLTIAEPELSSSKSADLTSKYAGMFAAIGKPEPETRHVWAKTRADLYETAPYFRQAQAGIHVDKRTRMVGYLL